MRRYSRQFTERLQNPDLSAVKEHFGHPLPPSVQLLYANREELLRQDFEVAAVPDAGSERRWYVAFYQPADQQSAQDTWPGLEKYFAFADDGCGNGYLIDPQENDPPVAVSRSRDGRTVARMQWFFGVYELAPIAGQRIGLRNLTLDRMTRIAVCHM